MLKIKRNRNLRLHWTGCMQHAQIILEIRILSHAEYLPVTQRLMFYKDFG